MSISSALNAGVQGLNVNATRLATISDNIANSATIGYKRTETDFTSAVLAESRGRYTAGGVRVTTRREVQSNGLLQSTSNSTDISINGRGFLPIVETVTPANNLTGGKFQLATTGSFRPDAAGFLKNTNGQYLLGWPIDAQGVTQVGARDSSTGLETIRVSGREFSARATSEIGLSINLPAAATKAGGTGDPFTLPVEYFDNVGDSASITFQFTPSVPATGASNSWDLTITDSASPAPGTVGQFTLVFDDSRTTGGTLLSVTPTTGTYDATTGKISLSVDGGPMEIDIGIPGDARGLTQLSGEFAPVSISKNGAPFGNLSDVLITESGQVEAVFNNGERIALYQIPVVDIPNADGLTATDGQAFKVSPLSGDIYLWDAGTGPVGGTVGFALEQSTTDIAKELTNLIETQRAYSSNAKIIQTVDEMLQETTNIKR